MDQVKQIEDQIVAGSEGFFDEPDIRKDLHVTICIASNFRDFLEDFGTSPPAKEIAYVMDTIRSGMDEFFALAYSCRVINTGNDTWAIEAHIHWDFALLREKFLRGFEHLAGSPDISPVHALASLLALTHLELVFLAQQFPSLAGGGGRLAQSEHSA